MVMVMNFCKDHEKHLRVPEQPPLQLVKIVLMGDKEGLRKWILSLLITLFTQLTSEIFTLLFLFATLYSQDALNIHLLSTVTLKTITPLVLKHMQKDFSICASSDSLF